ncbi:MAG: cyclic nucleotide-binding domain-containing protein [Clostridia bacterium]|nr:cyclic nucleotide-binding domain-containing protein [Clostridia bacterium]
MASSKREYRTYKKGEIIFRQGDPADCMYDIRWGSVGIYLNYGTAQEKMLAQLRGNEIFGEMGLVDEVPRSATAVAMEMDTRAEVVTRETFSGYLEERPERVIAVMQSMSKRIRTLTEDYLDACRAVTEAVNAGESGEEKSIWFKDTAGRFVEEYKDGKAGTYRVK